MSDRHVRRPAKQEPRTEGLCQATPSEFATYLRSRGFAASTICQYVAVVERFRSWLHRSRKVKKSIGEVSAAIFVRRCRTKDHLRQVGHIRSSLKHLIRMLRGRGELAGTPASPPTVIEVAIEQFVAHLRNTCGLAESTCRNRGSLCQAVPRQQVRPRPFACQPSLPKRPHDVCRGICEATNACIGPTTRLCVPPILAISAVAGSLYR